MFDKDAQPGARSHLREALHDLRSGLKALRSWFTRDITPIVVGFSVLMLAAAAFTRSHIVYIAAAALIPLAWAALFLMALRRPQEKQPLNVQFKVFRYQVDLLHQQLNRDPKALDQRVLQAFDKLHEQVKLLLKQKKIRFAQLEREASQFPYPKQSAPTGQWNPPSLSELGYVFGVPDTYSPDAPVLALYKFAGEERQSNGAVVDTFTVLTADGNVSPGFKAKRYSPITNYTVGGNKAPASAVTDVAAPAAAVSTNVSHAPIEVQPPIQSHVEPQPTVDPHPVAVVEPDSSVGYALSLLGPITLQDVSVVEHNLQVIAQLRPAPPTGHGLSAAVVRQGLRDLLTDKVAQDDVALPAAVRALQQAPQLFVCGLADACREGAAPGKLRVLTDNLAGILLPAAPVFRSGLVKLMAETVQFVHALKAVPATAKLTNPGLAYIEARGAEGEAGFLRLLAALLTDSSSSISKQPKTVVMTTNLTEAAFRAQLSACSALKPSEENQIVLDMLLVALNVKRLTLNVVDGNQRVAVKDVRQGAAVPYSVLSANPALVDLAGAAPPVQHLLWTLNGRALLVDGAARQAYDALHFGLWQQAIQEALADASAEKVVVELPVRRRA